MQRTHSKVTDIEMDLQSWNIALSAVHPQACKAQQMFLAYLQTKKAQIGDMDS